MSYLTIIRMQLIISCFMVVGIHTKTNFQATATLGPYLEFDFDTD